MNLVKMSGKVAGKVLGGGTIQKVGEDGKPVFKDGKPVMVNPEIEYLGIPADAPLVDVMAVLNNDEEVIRTALIEHYNSKALEEARNPFTPFLTSVTDKAERQKIQTAAKALVDFAGFSVEKAVKQVLDNIKK